jgi:hypothetical protein
MTSVVPGGIIVTGKTLTLSGGKSVYYLKTKKFKWLIKMITLLKELLIIIIIIIIIIMYY